MKAICTTTDRGLEIRDIPAPTQPAAEHVLIDMAASAINPGDIAFLKHTAPGQVPKSLYDVWGVSGAGTVIAIGHDVPASYLGKQVAVYRSLVSTGHTIGTWCNITQMHHATCVILPDTVDATDYSGSLVNTITPYAFLKQVQQELHQGILVTAGTSATGLAMLGIALAYEIPIVSIVRDAAGKKELASLGAQNVLVRADPNFDQDLAAMTEAHKATAIFDGVGGDLLTRILPLVARGSTVYAYGYLGGDSAVSLHSSTLMAKNMTIKHFSNFASSTVQTRSRLTAALDEISKIIGMSHFRTKRGMTFHFEGISDAMKYVDPNGGKAILAPG